MRAPEPLIWSIMVGLLANPSTRARWDNASPKTMSYQEWVASEAIAHANALIKTLDAESDSHESG